MNRYKLVCAEGATFAHAANALNEKVAPMLENGSWYPQGSPVAVAFGNGTPDGRVTVMQSFLGTGILESPCFDLPEIESVPNV